MNQFLWQNNLTERVNAGSGQAQGVNVLHILRTSRFFQTPCMRQMRLRVYLCNEPILSFCVWRKSLAWLIRNRHQLLIRIWSIHTTAISFPTNNIWEMSKQATINELIAGSFGGAAQVLVGQPLDTIKTRAQIAPSTYPNVFPQFLCWTF